MHSPEIRPQDQLKQLRHELGKYNPQLLEKKMIIAINKIDLATESDIEAVRRSLSEFDCPQVFISAREDKNIQELINRIALFFEQTPQ
jgi:GTPase involved in cell partitioning and DNA repair